MITTDMLSLFSTNLVIILGVMQVAKKIPFEDPNVLNACRGAYVISNILILFVYLYIQSAVNKKKGTNYFSLPPNFKLHT